MSSRELRELEKLLKAAANRRRLGILQYLKRHKSGASVTDIAAEIDLSLKATSKHLRVLHALGIVERQQRSFQGYYRLAKEQKRIVRDILSRF